MQQLQVVFDEMVENKKELKGLKEMYRDALKDTDQYDEIVEQIKELRAKKKSIELAVQGKMGRSYEKIEELTSEIKAQKVIISDIAMTTLMDGKTVEVSDPFGNVYEPEYKVNLKKTDKVFNLKK